MNLTEYLISRGYPQAAACPLDGTYHRFDHAGSLSGWFKGVKLYAIGERKGFGVIAAFGDFKTGEKFEFQDLDDYGTAPETLLYIQAELAKLAEEEAQDRKRVQEEVAASLEADWSDAIDRGSTPYLKRKGLPELFGAKICPDYPDTLMVPGRDIDGKLWTIQRILPQKLDSGLDKLMKKGGRIEGCFHLMGEISQKGTIHVCEGFATAASVFLALGKAHPVVTAFNAGNLGAVAGELRARYPDASILFCADHDAYTVVNGKPVNPGVEKALAAAKACNGTVVAPNFREPKPGQTDFNDLHMAEGLESVKQQILNPIAPKTLEKKKKFSEKLVTEWMLEWAGGKLARQDKNLFLYSGVKWGELDSHGIDALKNKINSMCGDALTSKDVASIYNTFFRYVPAVPEGVNLFEPARDKANFQNGTLHIEFSPKTPEELALNRAAGTHNFKFVFRPHNPLDYCTTVIPLDYKPHAELAENPHYEQMLKNVWPDPDFQGKKNFYEEVLGSCIAPLMPKITFFVGGPGTGKSTLIMLGAKLVGPGNASGSDLTTWGDAFGLEPMVNKLVNFDTDISTTRRISDDLAKKVIDGRVSIRRKNKTNVEARLPAVHIFGANEMPKSAEGMSGAYNRRAVILRTETVQPGQGGGGEFSDWIWAQGREGVLKAALRGLERLLANGGIYSTPESSREEMKAWGKENDHLQQFIDAIEAGEVTHGSDIWVIAEGAKVSSQTFYTRFIKYVEDTDMANFRAGRYLSAMGVAKKIRRDQRFGSWKDEHRRYVLGCGVRGQEGSKF